MRRSSESPRRAVVVGCLLFLLSLALLFFDRRDGEPGPASAVISGGLRPVHEAATGWGRRARVIWMDYVAVWDVRRENVALEARLQALEAQSTRVAELEAANARLRRMLELSDSRKDLRLVPGRVTARSNSPFFRVLKLELSFDDASRVEPGMPVIAPSGVVGQIRTVQGDRADVLLVTDPRSAIDVVLEQSKARGVAVGTGDSKRYAARLQYLDRAVKAVDGERVLTTGDDQTFPRGLALGVVEDVGVDEAGPFQRVTVRPLVDPSTLEEVFVVLGQSGLTDDGGRFNGRSR